MTGSIGENVDRLFDVGNNPNESIGFSEEVQGNRLIVWTGGDLDPTNYIISNLYNTWVHFAIVRNNNTLELYKDGTRLFYTSNNRLIEDNTSDLQIGGGSGQKFNGYLTNFHFLKGVVKYNGTFTPSTTPLNPTEFTETKLLLSVTSSNTTFIDSKGNHVASIIGGTWSSESPFLPTGGVQGTLSFDGSQYNYLTYQNANLAITGNFTLELFFSKYLSNNYDGLISIGSDIAVQFANINSLWGKIGGGISDFGTTNDIKATNGPIFNWQHLVIQNNTNIISLLLDGVVLATQSWTGTTGDTINIGKGLFGNAGVLHGLVSNVRFSNNVRYVTSNSTLPPFDAPSPEPGVSLYYIQLMDGNNDNVIMFDGFFYVDDTTHIVLTFYDLTNPTVDIRSTGNTGGATYQYYPEWLCFDGGGCNLTSFPYFYGSTQGDYNLYGNTSNSTGGNVDDHGNITYVFRTTPFRYNRPTGPFTSDANTLLLVTSPDDTNKYLDQGIYSIPVWDGTQPGNPNPTWVSDTNPYMTNSGSIYFDGVSTYLNFPGCNDWAIDLPNPTYRYYNVNGYSCNPFNFANTYTVFVPYGTPLTIGYFYNNPENPGYSFEILEEVFTQVEGYDLTGVQGYATGLESCTL